MLEDTLVADGTSTPTVEHWLTRLRTMALIAGGDSIRGMTAIQIERLEAAIVEQIVDIVTVALPADGGGFDAVSRWAGAFDRRFPLEIFTLNYDLLMEQSLERHRVAYFDGFLGAYEPFLDLRTMEDDSLPTRWTRLWKMHGSVNWSADGARIFRASAGAGNRSKSLVHPSHLKYDQSRRMPYLAMQDRLRSYLRQDGALLLIEGYSFADEHINEILIEGLAGNPSAVAFALLFKPLGEHEEAVRIATRTPNVRLMGPDGAVIGGTRAPWQQSEDLQRVAPSEIGNFARLSNLLQFEEGAESA